MNALAAVILAAGRGMRLAPATDHTPKPLVSVCGRPILEWILNAFSQSVRVPHFWAVTGYRAADFHALKVPPGHTLSFIENSRWAETNSMASLALAMPKLQGSQGGYIVEGDCCFDAALLQAPQALAHENVWFVRPFSENDDGCCLWTDADGRIERLSIEKKSAANAGPNRWKSCGVLRIGSTLAANLDRWLQEALRAGRERDYYDLILRDHLSEAALYVADIGLARWFEIDSPEDLQYAEKLFSPSGFPLK